MFCLDWYYAFRFRTTVYFDAAFVWRIFSFFVPAVKLMSQLHNDIHFVSLLIHTKCWSRVVFIFFPLKKLHIAISWTAYFFFISRSSKYDVLFFIVKYNSSFCQSILFWLDFFRILKYAQSYDEHEWYILANEHITNKARTIN